MKPKSAWVMACTGLTLIGLLAIGYGVANAHPIHHLEYLTVLVNCGSGLETHEASTERQPMLPHAVCFVRNDAVVESTGSVSGCDGRDCGRVSGDEREQPQSAPSHLRRSQL